MGLFPKPPTGFFFPFYILILILIFIYFFKYETIVRSRAWSFVIQIQIQAVCKHLRTLNARWPKNKQIYAIAFVAGMN